MITAQLGLGVVSIVFVASNALSARAVRDAARTRDEPLPDEAAAAIAEAQSLLDNALPHARPQQARAVMLEHNGLAARRRRA